MTAPNTFAIPAPAGAQGDADFPGAWIGGPTLIYDATMVPPPPDTGGKVYRNTFNDVLKLAAMARAIQGMVTIEIVGEMTIDGIEVDFGPEYIIQGPSEDVGATLACVNGGHLAATVNVVSVTIRQGVDVTTDGVAPVWSFSDPSAIPDFTWENALADGGSGPIVSLTGGAESKQVWRGDGSIVGAAYACDADSSVAVLLFDLVSWTGGTAFAELGVRICASGVVVNVELLASLIVSPGVLFSLDLSGVNPNTAGLQGNQGALFCDPSTQAIWIDQINGTQWAPIFASSLDFAYKSGVTQTGNLYGDLEALAVAAQAVKGQARIALIGNAGAIPFATGTALAFGPNVLFYQVDPSDSVAVGPDGGGNPTSLSVSVGSVYEFKDCNVTVSQAGAFLTALAADPGQQPLLVRLNDAFIVNGIDDDTSLFLSAPTGSSMKVEMRGRSTIAPFTSGETHVKTVDCNGAVDVEVWLYDISQIAIDSWATASSSLQITPNDGALVDEALSTFFLLRPGTTFAGAFTTPVGNVPGIAGAMYYSTASQTLFVGTGSGDLAAWATLAGPAV